MSRASSAPTTDPPIEDYGLIGDCHSAALVSSHGSIDWLCLPRFDSPSIFARILDVERTDAWSLHPTGQFHAQHQYLEYTNVLETIFTSDQGRVRLLDFMPILPEVTSGTVSSLRTVLRIVEGIDGKTELESNCAPRLGYGKVPPAFATRPKTAILPWMSTLPPRHCRQPSTSGAPGLHTAPIKCPIGMRSSAAP